MAWGCDLELWSDGLWISSWSGESSSLRAFERTLYSWPLPAPIVQSLTCPSAHKSYTNHSGQTNSAYLHFTLLSRIVSMSRFAALFTMSPSNIIPSTRHGRSSQIPTYASTRKHERGSNMSKLRSPKAIPISSAMERCDTLGETT